MGYLSATASPNLGSARSARSSASSSSHYSHYFPIKDVTSSNQSAYYGSPFYRHHTLRPNDIIVEDGILGDERWSRLAFALGMPFRDTYQTSHEGRRLAQKLRSKRNVTERQMSELLLPFVLATTRRHAKIRAKVGATFHADAVPTSPSSSQTAWSMPLPVPRPNITVGFTPKVFDTHALELQSGIISNFHGEPCDLAKVSQPAADLFWPFFVIEVQEESVLAAQNACAGSASTCNNAFALLSEAADNVNCQKYGQRMFWSDQRAIHSFSLAVSGKVAALNIHTSNGGLSHRSSMIRMYSLDDELEIDALAARLSSIFIWAENTRLPNVMDLLANLDDLVKLEDKDHLSDAFTNQNLIVPTHGDRTYGTLSPKKRSLSFKAIFSQFSPTWIRILT